MAHAHPRAIRNATLAALTVCSAAALGLAESLEISADRSRVSRTGRIRGGVVSTEMVVVESEAERKQKRGDFNITSAAEKLESRVRLESKDMTWPQDSFVKCLEGNNQTASKALRMKQCLVANQARCESPRVQPVCAWAAGFGSGIHMWVHSLTYALERGHVWVPTGPWSYVDEQRCPDVGGVPAGQSCYFKEVTRCQATTQALPKVCAQWYNHHNASTIVINVARQLNVTREWVWGHLTSYMMQMQPDVQEAVDRRIPRKLLAGPSAAIQIRVVSAATGQDGMRVNLGVASYLKKLESKFSEMQVRPKMIYVMSDDPSLTEEKLNMNFPDYEFLRPERQWADVARGDVTNQNQSKSTVTYDLLADIFAAVRSEVFIGTASNLFWLVYALKQTKVDPGISCWINTVEASPEFKRLFCPGDPGFYTYSPAGLRPNMEEEYVSLLRDGLDRKSAWWKALENHHKRTRIPPMALNKSGKRWRTTTSGPGFLPWR